jgi:hypothetical protein
MVSPLQLAHSSLHAEHVSSKCKKIPKAFRPRKKRRVYSVAYAFLVDEQLKEYLRMFPGEEGLRKFRKTKGMTKQTLNSLLEKVVLYNESPPPRGLIGKANASASAGSGRKPSAITPEMSD